MSPLPQAAKKGWTALHFASFLIDLEAIGILLGSKCDASLLTEVYNICHYANHAHFDEVIMSKQTSNKTAAVFSAVSLSRGVVIPLFRLHPSVTAEV